MEVLYRLSYRGTFCSWGREDSNLRRRSRQIYSLLPLAARAHPRARLGTRAPKRPDMVANATEFSTEALALPKAALEHACFAGLSARYARLRQASLVSTLRP